MEGISKEDLMTIIKYGIDTCKPLTDTEVLEGLLVHWCKELNPWQPIETAPKDRKIRLLFPESRDKAFNRKVIESFYNVDKVKIYWERLPSFWQEITPDPKT